MKRKITPKRIFQNRLALFFILLSIQSLFFVTNLLNSLLRDAEDGWELKIGFIDDNLTPMGIWLIPYALGFCFAALVPLWAAYNMSNKLYRQFILSMALAASCSYVIYMLFPTYVVKPALDDVTGNDIFSELLRTAYKADNTASTHNAAPSQHVFYALLNMCYMIRFRPAQRVFWAWITLATLITVSALFTRQHHSPDLITGYAMALFAYWAGLRLGEYVTARLGDEDAPIVTPMQPWKRRRSAGMSADPT